MAGMAAGREFTFLWWVATLFCRAPKAAFCAAGILAPTAAKSTAEAVMRAAIVSGEVENDPKSQT